MFKIFPGHRVLDPITNPYLGTPLGYTLLQVLHSLLLMNDRVYK